MRTHPGDGVVVRISNDASRSVVFFGIPSPPKGEIKYCGTALLAAYQDADNQLHAYLVTARHVASALQRDDGFVIRANLKGGGSEPIPVHGIEWCYPDDENVDLAVAAHYLDKRKYDLDYLGLAAVAGRGPFLDERGINRMHIACGDEIAVVGLFHLHSGRRNCPEIFGPLVAPFRD